MLLIDGEIMADYDKRQVFISVQIWYILSNIVLLTHSKQALKQCRFHFAEILSFVDAPLATNNAACTTLANILLKAQVLNVSDKEKAVGCLRRQEKLSI